MKKGQIMKKLTVAAILLLMLLCFASCGSTPQSEEQPPFVTLPTPAITEHTHSYSDWVVLTESGCTNSGSRIRVCACGANETEIVDAKGHTPGEWQVSTPPTCTQDGVRTLNCSVCGELLESATEIMVGHSYGEWEVSKAATCTEDGQEVSTCSTCKDRKTQPIAAVGHKPGEWVTVSAPSCTASGTKAKTCSVCNTKTETENIPAKGHTEGEWVTVSAPSCTASGTKAKICAVCNTKTETETIPATGHTEGEWVTVSAPSCTASGTKTKTCSVCNTQTAFEYIPAIGHTPSEWVNVSEPTKADNGLAEKTCTVCKASIEKKIIPALGYSAEDISIVLPKTPVTSTYTKVYRTPSFDFEYYDWTELVSISYEVTKFNSNSCDVAFTFTIKNAGQGDDGKVTNPSPTYGAEITMYLFDEDGNKVKEIRGFAPELLLMAEATFDEQVTIPYGKYDLYVVDTVYRSGDRNTPPTYEDIIVRQ